MKTCFLLSFILFNFILYGQMDAIYYNSFQNWNINSDGWKVIDNDTNSLVVGHTFNLHTTTSTSGSSSEVLDDLAGLYKFSGQLNQIMITPIMNLGSQPYVQMYSISLAYLTGTSSIECWVIPNSSDTTLTGITDSIKVLNSNGYNLISLSNYSNTSIRLAFKLKVNPQIGINPALGSIAAIDDFLVFNKSSLVYIPDNNFRNHLQSALPTAFIGDSLNYLSPTVLSTTQIQANSLNIHSLEGIQYFPFLKILKAHHNQLLNLHINRFPYLDTLNVSYNLISVLPDMPKATRLYFDHNLVHTFPEFFNKSIEILYANNNLINGCLPCSNRFVKGSVLNNISVYVPCIYYFLQYLYATPSTCFTSRARIKGKVFYDQNNDGVFNSGDLILPNQAINYQQSTDIPTNSLGNYNLLTEANQADLNVIDIPSYFSCLNPLSTYLTADQEITHDFRIVANQVVNNLSINIETITNTTNNFIFQIIGENLGTNSINSIVKVKLPNGSVYSSSTFGSVINDTLYWNLNLLPFGTSINEINILTTSLPINTILNVNATAQLFGDIDINNNTDIVYFTKSILQSNPHDPNYKLASDPIVDTGFYDYEIYTIRFENTGLGNATYVSVKDQLSPLLDITTFHYLGSTHPTIVDFGSDNIIQFTFNDITLTPKSIDSLHSYGFIWFKIKPIHPLNINDTIKNRASIIFNTEVPIVTDYSFVYVDHRIASNNIIDSETHCKGDTIFFSDLSSGSPILTDWDVSINNQSYIHLNSVTFNLDSIGMYKIREIVYWDNGKIDTLTKTIFVTQPEIQFNSIPTICNTENNFFLSFAEPQGGQFTGFAVNNNYLDATLLTSGQHTINYTYVDANGCVDISAVSINIGELFESFETQTLCYGESILWQNQSLNSAGSYTQYYVRSNGCDSILHLNLNYLNEIINDSTYDLCNGRTLNWNNQSILSAGVYQSVLTSSSGCDSIVNLTVQLQDNYSFLQQEFICPGNSIVWQGTVIDQPGMYTLMYQTEFGCDSIYNLHFTINQIDSTIDSHTSCGPFTWIDGNTYTSSNNTATYIVSNSAGCDSIITLDLTINSPSSSIDSNSACYSFTWIDGNTYTNSNNSATFVVPNSLGCDSIITLDLVINPLPNITITDNGNASISASVSTTYQWFDCTNNSIIVGETSQIFSPTGNGTYACIGTNISGCSDTSNCIVINNVSLNENAFNNLNIYPNPTSNSVTITFTSNSTANVHLFDAQGKFIQEKSLVSGESISLEKLDSGVYLMDVTVDNQHSIQRVVKQ